jgi:hypothetical protein
MSTCFYILWPRPPIEMRSTSLAGGRSQRFFPNILVSVPADGLSPAALSPLRRPSWQLSPFPLVELPYRRLVNPWTLGAVLHEVRPQRPERAGTTPAVPARIG